MTLREVLELDYRHPFLPRQARRAVREALAELERLREAAKQDRGTAQ